MYISIYYLSIYLSISIHLSISICLSVYISYLDVELLVLLVRHSHDHDGNLDLDVGRLNKNTNINESLLLNAKFLFRPLSSDRPFYWSVGHTFEVWPGYRLPNIQGVH